MDAITRCPRAVAPQSDATEAHVIAARQSLIESVAREVSYERSAQHLTEDLINVGWLALLTTAKDSNHVPFCKNFLRWAMLTFLRKERRHEHAEMAYDPVSDSLTPQQQAFYEQLWQLDSDPLVAKIHREGYTQAEVAKQEGISQGQVSRRLAQAEHRLRLAAA